MNGFQNGHLLGSSAIQMWKIQVVPTREKALIKESFQVEKGHPALRPCHWMQKGLGKSPDLGWANLKELPKRDLSSKLFANISPRTWEISCLCLHSLLFTGEGWGWDGADCSSGLWRSKWRPGFYSQLESIRQISTEIWQGRSTCYRAHLTYREFWASISAQSCILPHLGGEVKSHLWEKKTEGKVACLEKHRLVCDTWYSVEMR